MSAAIVQDISFEPQVQRVAYGNDEYIAVVPMPSLYFYRPEIGQLFLFQITDNVPSLIYQYGYDESPEYAFDASRMSLYFSGYEDYNGNGYPDLTVVITPSHSCANNILLLLEIYPSGEVLDITPQTTGNVSFARWTYLASDNTPAILYLEAFYVPYALEGCGYPRINRYFTWDGVAYRDVSATIDEANYPLIGSFWESLEADSVCILPSPLMYEMLLSEYVRGNFIEAWERLQPLLRWDACSAETLDEYGWVITDFETWITDYLPPVTPTPTP